MIRILAAFVAALMITGLVQSASAAEVWAEAGNNTFYRYDLSGNRLGSFVEPQAYGAWAVIGNEVWLGSSPSGFLRYDLTGNKLGTFATGDGSYFAMATVNNQVWAYGAAGKISRYAADGTLLGQTTGYSLIRSMTQVGDTVWAASDFFSGPPGGFYGINVYDLNGNRLYGLSHDLAVETLLNVGGAVWASYGTQVNVYDSAGNLMGSPVHVGLNSMVMAYDGNRVLMGSGGASYAAVDSSGNVIPGSWVLVTGATADIVALQVVPEPATFMLLAIGAGAAVLRRRKISR